MGFASGSASFRRFFIVGQRPTAWTDEWHEAVAANAFGRQPAVASDGVEVGWIVPNHLFDVDFSEPHRVQFERFVYLAMRIDRTAPPASILRSYRAMEERAALQASGRETLTRNERRLAKDAAEQRAKGEAEAGMFRRIAAYPVLLDMEEGVVYFGSLGVSAADRLIRLFSDTFRVTIAPATLDEVAARTAQKRDLTAALDDASPTYLADHPTGGDHGHHDEVDGDGSIFAPGDRSFLGREFLTWLWHGVEHDEGVFTSSRDSTLLMTIQKAMNLECMYGVTGRVAVVSDAPARARESKSALHVGKQPTRLGLILSHNGDEYTFTLDGPKWQVSGLVMPPPEEMEPHALLIDRFGHFRTVSAAMDGLFESFLARRLNGVWASESATLRRWAVESGRLQDAQLATA
jgi:hypothetical protein